jgi:radical SAM protein with 4Fe4S-binding SPASM domain
VRLAPDAATPARVAELAAAGARRVVLALGLLDDVAARRAADAVHGTSLALEVETTLRPATAALVGPAGRVAAALHPVLWRVVFALPALPGGHDFAPATAEAMFRALLAWHRTTGLAVTTTNAPAFRRIVLDARNVRLPHPLPLGDGKGLVFVSRTGRIQPSEHLPLSAGDLATDRLVDVYRRSRLFRTLRATWRLEGRCGRCRWQAVCGGSRARAFAATASLLGEDPACAYDPPRAAPAPGARAGG